MPPVKDLGLILEESKDVAGALKRRIEKRCGVIRRAAFLLGVSL